MRAAQALSIAERPNAEAMAHAVHDLVKKAKRLEGGKRAQ
jgi:uroporphyrinogen-III synthase